MNLSTAILVLSTLALQGQSDLPLQLQGKYLSDLLDHWPREYDDNILQVRVTDEVPGEAAEQEAGFTVAEGTGQAAL